MLLRHLRVVLRSREGRVAIDEQRLLGILVGILDDKRMRLEALNILYEYTRIDLGHMEMNRSQRDERQAAQDRLVAAWKEWWEKRRRQTPND